MRFFIQRAGKPSGYFAYGVAVAVDKEYQLRLTDEKYRDFSEAYLIESYRNGFVIFVGWVRHEKQIELETKIYSSCRNPTSSLWINNIIFRRMRDIV